MMSCEVLVREECKKRSTKREPTLVLRSVPNGEVSFFSQKPPSYDKCISPTARTKELPNGLSNKTKGTETIVKALVHHDSCDNEEKGTLGKEKAEAQPIEKIPHGHVTPIPNRENMPENAEIELEVESIDIHGDRTNHKDTDVNDNYLTQEKQIQDEIDIARTENDIRNYVISEQAKGIQYKNSFKRPPYASLIYAADEIETEPKMHYLKVSDCEDSLSGIDLSESELDSDYEGNAELFLPGTLDRLERGPYMYEDLATEEETLRKQEKPYIELLADILLGNDVPRDMPTYKTKNGDDIVAFLADAPQDIRNIIVHYLKKKKLSCVLLDSANFHYVLHTGDDLDLPQLVSHCFEYLDENPQFDQKSLVMGCDSCQNVIRTRNVEKATTVKSATSRCSVPHFCIAFSRKEAQRTNIEVIDINTGSEIYSRDTRRPFLCERGFSCLGMHYSDCPYIFVGGGKHKHSKQLWRYDVIVSEWKKMPNMIHGRSYQSMISFNDCAIYVIGGSEVDCIEEFSLDTKKWRECATLNFPVESGACAVYDKKIYIFGSNDSVGRVQCFTPSLNRVETLHPLPCPVMEGHAVVFQDKIFIVSGQGKVVYFEPVTGLSYLGAYQPVIRSNFCLFVNKDKLYITGGRLDEESPDVESEYNYRYNMSTDAWTRTRKLPRRFRVHAYCDIHLQRRCPIVPFDKMKI